MNIVQTISEFATLFCCGMFAGAAIYITLVEHPARLACASEVAMAQFRPSYERATVMQAPSAIGGFVAVVLAWLFGREIAWLVGGLLLIAVVPLALIAMFPTNRQLFDLQLDVCSERAASLLQRWGKLHAARTFRSVAALPVFLYALRNISENKP